MTSAYFNVTAQNALSILTRNNRQIAEAGKAVSTGLKVVDASDNASLWAISQNFQSDLVEYSALSDGLSLGASTVAVARAGAESIVDLLNDIKTEIINSTATDATVDANQSAIDGYVSQIESVVSTASFNGVNLLQNRLSSSSTSYSVLSSIDSDSGSSQSINVDYQDLQTDTATFGGGAVTLTNYFGDAGGTVAVSSSLDIDIVSGGVDYGSSYRVTLEGGGAHAFGSSQSFEYVARNGDTRSDVATALYDEIGDYIEANDLSSSVTVSLDATNGQLTINNLDATNTLDVTNAAASGGAAGGALEALAAIDVTTASGRSSALATIETLIDRATNAAAALGASETRIETQSAFLSELSAVVSSGLSSLVDADIEAESAKLAAAEAQRELSLYFLSIANADPKRLIDLFRQN